MQCHTYVSDSEYNKIWHMKIYMAERDKAHLKKVADVGYITWQLTDATLSLADQ